MVWNSDVRDEFDRDYLGGCRLLYDTVKLVAGNASAPKGAGTFNTNEPRIPNHETPWSRLVYWLFLGGLWEQICFLYL